MAESLVTLTVTDTDASQNVITARGLLTIGAGTYTTAGIAITFAGFDAIKSNSTPLRVFVYSQQPAGSGATALFVYNFNPGTTMANGKLQIFTGAAAQSGLAELSSGSMPAGVTGDVIRYEAVFPKFS